MMLFRVSGPMFFLGVGLPTWGSGVSPGDPPVVAPSGGHCSGRYASYWNACLFRKLNLRTCICN